MELDTKERDIEQAPVAASGPPPGPFGNVPNGGTQAWLQVVAGFALFFNTWGILNVSQFTVVYELTLT